MIYRCIINRIYLLTVAKSKSDLSKIDIVNFMSANEIDDVCVSSRLLKITCTSMMIEELRLYLRSYMMGSRQNVIIYLSDFNMEYSVPFMVKVDKGNLLEMSKKGYGIKLR